MHTKAMKIIPQDYTRLQAIITNNPEVVKHGGLSTIHAAYIEKGLTTTRFIWDTWHTVMDNSLKNNVENYLFMRMLSDYLNDSHIQTAIKSMIQ